MRVYFIHVYKRRWDFFPEREPDETAPADGPEARFGSAAWIASRANNVRKSIDEADSGVKGRIRVLLERMHRGVDPVEPLLKRMRSAGALEIIHPSGVNSRYVKRRLHLLLRTKTAMHKRGIYVNSFCLPLSIAATVLPGPNVFFAWNAYRLVSHVRAHQGGTRVLTGRTKLVFTASDELGELHDRELRRSGPLEPEVATRIAERLQIPDFVEYLRRTGGVVAEPDDVAGVRRGAA